MKRKVIDCATGEVTEIELTKEEIKHKNDREKEELEKPKQKTVEERLQALENKVFKGV